MHGAVQTNLLTNDAVIRVELKKELIETHGHDGMRVIEELGLDHGTARIDFAVVNGVMKGYEIKSDRDTLLRLPEQMQIYNSIFDEMTLVVGKMHLYEAIHLVPDWWGIRLAKLDAEGNITFNTIRESGKNTDKDPMAFARLLWRSEALTVLRDEGVVRGVQSKTRSFLYARMCEVFDQETLEGKVRQTLIEREGWRFDERLVLSGD